MSTINYLILCSSFFFFACSQKEIDPVTKLAQNLAIKLRADAANASTMLKQLQPDSLACLQIMQNPADGQKLFSYANLCYANAFSEIPDYPNIKNIFKLGTTKGLSLGGRDYEINNTYSETTVYEISPEKLNAGIQKDDTNTTFFWMYKYIRLDLNTKIRIFGINYHMPKKGGGSEHDALIYLPSTKGFVFIPEFHRAFRQE